MKLFVVGLLTLSIAAAATAAPSAHSTGELLIGGIDAYWRVSGPPTSFTAIPAVELTPSGFPYNAYAPNDANSKWISFASDGGNSMNSIFTEGIYVYSTVVDFTGSTGVLTGHLFSDNAVLDVSVGANSYGLAPLATPWAANSANWFTQGSDFSITGLSGLQVVSFTIRNGILGEEFNPDPTAFRTSLSLQAVPEPFTMALMGTAALAGFSRMRRRKNA